MHKDIKQRILINALYRYRVQIATKYIINTIFQSEADISEDETDNDDGNFYIGRDKQTRWRKTQIAPRAKTRGKNIVKKIPGPTSHARDASTELGAYLKIMDIDITDEIVKCTNKYMQAIRHKFARERRCTETSRSEIMALLGLLYLVQGKDITPM